MNSIQAGERVLVTGGTGSLGSALIPDLLASGARVRISSRDEKKQLDLRRQYPEIETRLGDVRDARAVYLAMLGIETVIHAASLKYVDVSERQPTEYVQTNVVGTINVLHAAQTLYTVRRVVGISTDKVPHAVNTYGLTKALLEKLFLEAHTLREDRPSRGAIRDSCHYVVARYGNVIGSRGSVVPFWAEQRRNGEALKVTDPTMTRFFFTLEDAVKLIDVALAAPSGTIVAQPMPACTLGQLAKVMSAPGSTYAIVGRRPGEKVHEELLTAEELARTEIVNGSHFVYSPLAPPSPETWNVSSYTSDRARRLTDDELLGLLKEWL